MESILANRQLNSVLDTSGPGLINSVVIEQWNRPIGLKLFTSASSKKGYESLILSNYPFPLSKVLIPKDSNLSWLESQKNIDKDNVFEIFKNLALLELIRQMNGQKYKIMPVRTIFSSADPQVVQLELLVKNLSKIRETRPIEWYLVSEALLKFRENCSDNTFSDKLLENLEQFNENFESLSKMFEANNVTTLSYLQLCNLLQVFITTHEEKITNDKNQGKIKEDEYKSVSQHPEKILFADWSKIESLSSKHLLDSLKVEPIVSSDVVQQLKH